MKNIDFLGYRMMPTELENYTFGTYVDLDNVMRSQKKMVRDVQSYEVSTTLDGATLILTIIKNIMAEEGKKALENAGLFKKGEALLIKDYLYNTDSWNEGFRLTVQKRLSTVRPGVEVILYTSGEMYTRIWNEEDMK